MAENDINWHDILCKSQERLYSISNSLDKYSKAFFIVGNEKIGGLLDIISEQLMEIEKDIGRASGQVISEQLTRAQENSANVLKAALAGIGVATRDKKD